MRKVSTCTFVLILAAARLVATQREESFTAVTERGYQIDNSTTTALPFSTAPHEEEEASTTTSVTSSESLDDVEEDETASKVESTTLKPSTTTTSSIEAIETTSTENVPPSTPSEPPVPPSMTSTPTPPSSSSSPPLSETPPSPSTTPSPSSTPSPSTEIDSSTPSVSILPELPLVSIPPVPEFLSFNEWREKYVVLPDPSIALARRTKKAAQRQRQDVVGSGSVGDRGATYDGDGADLGSLFASGEEIVVDEGGLSSSNGGPAGNRRNQTRTKVKPIPPMPVVPPSSSLSPIQPLPNVGSGDETDPLLSLRDRSNYAAFECAAMVHRSSRQSKHASSILVEKKDRYMLTPCRADPKFVEVELCDEIQIDTIVLANFEYFSSMFKHFRASCSVNYPGTPDEWHDLGTFRARNVRGVQVFRPNLTPQFCRYIRINFLSHFGSEYYCPVSLLRVYGYTQWDAYRESERKAKRVQEALAAAEEYVDEGEDVEMEVDDLVEQVVRPVEATIEGEIGEGKGSHEVESSATIDAVDMNTSTTETPTVTSSITGTSTATDQPASTSSDGAHFVDESISLSTPTSSPPHAQDHAGASSPTPSITDTNRLEGSRNANNASISTSTGSPSSAAAISSSDSSPTPSSPTASESSSSSMSTSSGSATETRTVHPSASPRPATPSDLPIIQPRQPRNETHHSQPHVYPHSPPPVHRPPVLPPPLQQPQPGESIYGTIMKRLTSLEHNQTLSMHFIEAQSSMLREAFGRVERRLTEVEAMRSRQEQGIRQALLDLEKERISLERERLTLSAQVGILAQETRTGKRLGLAQLVGILVLVIFVGFTRSIPTSPFLHLASSAGQGQREAKRGDKQKPEEVNAAKEKVSIEDSARKPLTRRLSGNGGSKSTNGHSKRYPSISKPGPRRHYGTGTTSSSRTPNFAKSPRAWTPPARHSSAPPEEGFISSASTALEGKEPRRRTSKRPGSPFEFPRRSKLEKEIGLAIENAVPSRNPPVPPFLASTSRQSSDLRGVQSSTAEDADTEPSDAGNVRPSFPQSMSSGLGDEHYLTTDDEDEPPSPAEELKSPIPQSPARGGGGIRPPKPNVPSRPATSMGIPFPKKTASFDGSSGFLRSPRQPAPPTPPSTLPSPPPEPAPPIPPESTSRTS